MKPIYKLKDWLFVYIPLFDLELLSLNENAIDFLNNYNYLINWYYLSANANAYELLMKNKDKIYYGNIGKNENPEIINNIIKPNINLISGDQLSANKNACFLLKSYPNKINWAILSSNTSNDALDLLEANEDKIFWYNFALNTNDRVIKILLKNPDKIVWSLLSSNSNDKIVDLLLKNQDKINWHHFSKNSNDKAVKILLENRNNINWNCLSMNSNSKIIKLLNENPNEINWLLFVENTNEDVIEIIRKNRKRIGDVEWNFISNNPKIFELDYITMKKNNELFEEELIKEVMKPKRICKYFEINDYDYLDNLFGY